MVCWPPVTVLVVLTGIGCTLTGFDSELLRGEDHLVLTPLLCILVLRIYTNEHGLRDGCTISVVAVMNIDRPEMEKRVCN
jgi:hypothetical protein